MLLGAQHAGVVGEHGHWRESSLAFSELFMADSVRTILARLEPIKGTVVFRPLNAEELQSLEREVGLPIPSALREYFGVVGLFEDLTARGNSDYEVFTRLNEFREMRQFLVREFGPPAANLFPFAGDGAGDVIAVKEGPEQAALFFADHETHKIREIGPFSDWLSSVVAAALAHNGSPNSQKKWCVQFSFRAATPEPILEVLRQFASVQLGEWSSEVVSPAGVRSSSASLTLGTEKLLLKKSEYHTWTQPMFSLDFDEPATLSASESRIRRFDAAFRAAGLGYKLVDYGPLDMTLVDEALSEAGTRPSASKPWWKFW